MPSTTDPAWSLTVGGTTFALPHPNVQLTSWMAYSMHGAPTLSWVWQGGPFPTRTGDPFIGTTIVLQMDTGSGLSTVFTGMAADLHGRRL